MSSIAAAAAAGTTADAVDGAADRRRRVGALARHALRRRPGHRMAGTGPHPARRGARDAAAAPPRRPAGHRPSGPGRRGPGPPARRAPLPRVALGAPVARALRVRTSAGGARGVPRAAPHPRRRTGCRAGAAAAPPARAGPRPRPGTAARRGPRSAWPVPSRPADAVEVHLPRRGTRFVGRDDELRVLAGLFAREPGRHRRRARRVRQDAPGDRGRRRRPRPVPGRRVVRGPVQRSPTPTRTPPIRWPAGWPPLSVSTPDRAGRPSTP